MEGFGPFTQGEGVTSGMSLRDYFAAKAMQSMVSYKNPDEIPEAAYRIADAMLEARREAHD